MARQTRTPAISLIMHLTQTAVFAPLGGKERGHQHEPGHPKCNKQIVMGLRQRGGIVNMVHVPDAKVATLRKVIEEHVNADVEVILTDDYGVYPIALKAFAGKHKTINHSKGLYVTGESNEIHTNTVESAFSLLKRAIHRELPRGLDKTSSPLSVRVRDPLQCAESGRPF